MAQPKHVYIIVDTPDHTRTIQEGHPPSQLSAYRLPVGHGEKQDDVVGEFVTNFPAGVVVGIVPERHVTSHRLAPRLESHDRKPGESVG